MVKHAAGALLTMIRIDPTSGRTKSAQLATGLRQAILEGPLRSGERLPATRILAEELSVARSTVVEAFEQLASEGLVETKTGSGTFVSHLRESSPNVNAALTTAPPRLAQPERLARLMETASVQFASRISHAPRAFATATPAFDAFPMAQWSRLVTRQWQRARPATLGYGDPLGYQALRAAISRHLRGNRGLNCNPSQIFIVAGAQQAFQLISSMLVDPGEAVWFEDPGAIGARNCFIVQGARVVPVPVDSEGLCVSVGQARSPEFQLAFVTPSHQQPLGVRMSHERRVALLQAAAGVGAFIIEDDWDGDFSLSGRATPALKAIDTGERVIYVGSFSKSMFPALRIGYLVAPPALVPTFEVALRAYSPGVPTILQAAVADFIDDGLFAAHIRRMRKLYAERQEVLLSEAENHLAHWMVLKPTTIGLHTVAYLKRDLIGAEVAAAAEAEGLTVAPISRFCVEPHGAEGLVLGFSGVTGPRISEGVVRLATALRQLDLDK